MPELVAIAQTGQAFVDAMRRTWGSGDAVLPVDPRLPAAAVGALLDAMRPARIIDATGDPASLPDPVPVEPGDAMVVPTSGSTGVPKGVAITHANVTQLMAVMDANVDMAEQVWSLWHSLAFDVSVCEMWGALLYGGRLVVVPESVARGTRRSGRFAVRPPTPLSARSVGRCRTWRSSCWTSGYGRRQPASSVNCT